MAQQGKEITDSEKQVIIDKLRVGFSKGYTVVQACLYAGISSKSYYRLFGENESLVTEFKDLRETPTLLAKDALFNALTEGDMNAAKYQLDRKDDEYKPESKTKVVTDDGQGGDAPIQSVDPIDYSKLSEETVRELLNATAEQDETKG